MKWTMSREPTAKSISHLIITRGGRGGGGAVVFFFWGGGGVTFLSNLWKLVQDES